MIDTGYKVDEKEKVREMGFLKRVLGIVFSPGQVMERLSGKPKVLFPIVVMLVAMPLLYIIRFPLFKDYTRNSIGMGMEIYSSTTGIEYTPEMIEQMVDLYSKIQLAIIPVGLLVVWILSSLLLFVAMKIFRGKGSYKQYLSVTGYAYVITILSMLLTFFVSFFTESLHMFIPLTSLAALFTGTEIQGTFIFGMLKGIEVFSIWHYAVIAIGLKYVSKLSSTKVYTIVACLYAIIIVINGMGEKMTGMLS